MKIAIHDSESNGHMNLALAKLVAWHRRQGDHVEHYSCFNSAQYDRVYSSKIFTWTKEDPYLPDNTEKGGTGYDIEKKLPENIEHTCPDYDFFGEKRSYGFLTRGCIRNCEWCFVPEKEGVIKAHADIKEFTRHNEVILMDNNVLAIDHGIQQIEKIIQLGLRIDFNQGLDARMIDNNIAQLLSRVKWLHPIRLACDQASQMSAVHRAVELLRWHNATPRRYFCYVLVNDIEDAIERVRFLKGLNVDPFCQPYRNKNGDEPTLIQRHFCRWVNVKSEYNSRTWEQYKNVKCPNTP